MFCRTLQLAAAAVALASIPVMAGGPPFLNLPVEGVTADNAPACAKVLTASLEDRVLVYAESKGVQLIERDGQWYATFPMGEDVRLSDVEAALEKSDFSIARDKLRLFGHVTVEIAADEAQTKALVADLDSLAGAVVEESSTNGELLEVTIAMPYPVEIADRDRGPAGWREFRWNAQLVSRPVKATTAPVDADSLVSIEAIGDVAARHDAKLADVRWNVNDACRSLGGVASLAIEATAAATGAQPQIAVQ